MIDQPGQPVPATLRLFPFGAAVFLTVAVVACSIYANLSFAVTNPAHFRFFPPFKRHVNVNANRHLGGEYFNMARSLTTGQGFAHPFDKPTGPTAWQPPVLPSILAMLLWVCGGRDGVMVVVVILQTCILVVTGLLVLTLAWQTNRRIGAWVTCAVFLVGLLCHFRLCFQETHDYWLLLLAVDLLIAGACWLGPLQRWQRAVGWGLFGGLSALLNPIVGFVWGVVTCVMGVRARAWSQLAVAALVAGLTLLPWTVRNYLVFGHVIPLKSNLAYELYQSQCLQRDGLLQGPTFLQHPYGATTRERKEYEALGEMAFLDRKRQQFWQAVVRDPMNFIERVAHRFLGATVWYVPLDRPAEARRPWVLRMSRLTHPLPFLALLVLLFTAAWERLEGAQWAVMGAYVLYLLPYIGASYYERYAVPLLGAKVLLVVWAADRVLSLLGRRLASPPARERETTSKKASGAALSLPGRSS